MYRQESVFLNGGVELLRCNTTQSWRRHKQCRRTKICNLTFISKFQGLALWKIQKRPLSPLHTGVCSCCQVWRCVLCAPLKAWWANVPFPRRCAPPSVASSRHFYNVVYLRAGELCARVRWALSPDCKYTSEVPHWHHTLGSHTHTGRQFGGVCLCSVIIQPRAASVCIRLRPRKERELRRRSDWLV